jgi:hypothetical protein
MGKLAIPCSVPTGAAKAGKHRKNAQGRAESHGSESISQPETMKQAGLWPACFPNGKEMCEPLRSHAT